MSRYPWENSCLTRCKSSGILRAYFPSFESGQQAQERSAIRSSRVAGLYQRPRSLQGGEQTRKNACRNDLGLRFACPQKIDHAGYIRYILQRNPPKYNDFGDEVDESEDEDEVDTWSPEENAYGGLKLEGKYLAAENQWIWISDPPISLQSFFALSNILQSYLYILPCPNHISRQLFLT